MPENASAEEDLPTPDSPSCAVCGASACSHTEAEQQEALLKRQVWLEDGELHYVGDGHDHSHDHGDSGPGHIFPAISLAGQSFAASSPISADGVGGPAASANAQTSTETGDAPANASTSASIDIDGVFIGSIGTPSDVDWIAIELIAGREYRFDLLDEASSRTTLSNPVLGGIFNADGDNLTGEDVDSGPSLTARLFFSPEESGTFFIQAEALGGQTGSYTLNVRDVGFAPGPDLSADSLTQGEVLVGGSLISAIDEADDVDFIAVDLEAGITYQIDIFGAFTDTGLSLIDPVLDQIVTSSGAPLVGTSADDGGSVFNSRLLFTPDSTDTFFLQVSGVADQTGTYEISVTVALPEVSLADDLPSSVFGALVSPTNLVVGDSLTGALNTAGDVDVVRVTLEAGVPVSLVLNAGDGVFSAIDDPNITGVFTSDGSAVPLAFDDDSGPGLNSRLTLTPETGGEFFVVLDHASGDGIGSYTFSVEAAETSSVDLPIGPTSPDTFGLVSFSDTTTDPLISPFVSGVRHAVTPGADGEVLLTYSFPDEFARFANNYPEGGPNEFIFGFTEGQQALTADAFDQLSAFLPVSFFEVADTDESAGIFRFAFTAEEREGAAAFAFFPSSAQSGSDTFLVASNILDTDARGSFTHVAILHEIGHAMGLTHPFLDDEEDLTETVVPIEFDSFASTVMANQTRLMSGEESGFSDFFPTTYMYLDIMALQFIYGAIEANTGNNTYTFDGDIRFYETLWDTGGTDAIRIENQSDDVFVTLVPGSWIDVGTSINLFVGGIAVEQRTLTVFIPPEVTIENAFGDAGNDVLVGNLTTNFIAGGDGDDLVLGGDAADELFAGPGDTGDDRVFGEAGDDVVGVGAGDDLAVGDGVDSAAILSATGTAASLEAAGSDTLFGGAGDDTLIGGGLMDENGNGIYDEGEEVFTDGADVVFAGTGSDLVFGSEGGDTLGGGSGDDSLNGGSGADIFFGGQGDGDDIGTNDVIGGGGGNDTVFGSGGSDVISGGAGADELFGGVGDDSIAGGAGGDTLFAGAGNDTLAGGGGADIFSFNNGAGDNVISDFDLTADILRIAAVTTDFQSASDVAAAASTATQGGASGLLIELGGGATVFLVGLEESDLASLTLML